LPAAYTVTLDLDRPNVIVNLWPRQMPKCSVGWQRYNHGNVCDNWHRRGRRRCIEYVSYLSVIAEYTQLQMLSSALGWNKPVNSVPCSVVWISRPNLQIKFWVISMTSWLHEKATKRERERVYLPYQWNNKCIYKFKQWQVAGKENHRSWPPMMIINYNNINNNGGCFRIKVLNTETILWLSPLCRKKPNKFVFSGEQSSLHFISLSTTQLIFLADRRL